MNVTDKSWEGKKTVLTVANEQTRLEYESKRLRSKIFTVNPSPCPCRYQWFFLSAYPNQLRLQFILAPLQIVQYVHRSCTLRRHYECYDRGHACFGTCSKIIRKNRCCRDLKAVHEIAASRATVIPGLLERTALPHDEFVTGGVEGGQVSVSRRSAVRAPVRWKLCEKKENRKNSPTGISFDRLPTEVRIFNHPTYRPRRTLPPRTDSGFPRLRQAAETRTARSEL